MDDLLELQACKPQVPSKTPTEGGKIRSPLYDRREAWASLLGGHPDRLFYYYICSGLVHGFRIGFGYGSHTCRSGKGNMQSVLEHPEVVSGYLQREVSLGRVKGPLGPEAASLSQVSPFGVIPKSAPGQWRLILDLSHPEGRSVNDGINPAWCSLSYVSVDNLIEVICSLGRGALLAKVDVQSAYRLVPVFPEDCWLLGMHWSGECFVDAMLPFGLRSAPKIFNAVADALQWIIRARGVDFILHYLDDFVVVGEPGSLQCHQAFSTVKEVCAELGVPLAADKSMGPTMCLTFLGIELDTSLMQIRLPAAKLAKLIELVEWWLGRLAGTKKELQSLAGHLQHACRVVRPGRCFLRRLFELIAVARRQGQVYSAA